MNEKRLWQGRWCGKLAKNPLSSMNVTLRLHTCVPALKFIELGFIEYWFIYSHTRTPFLVIQWAAPNTSVCCLSCQVVDLNSFRSHSLCMIWSIPHVTHSSRVVRAMCPNRAPPLWINHKVKRSIGNHICARFQHLIRVWICMLLNVGFLD